MTGDYNIQHLPAVTDGSRISTQAVNTRGGGGGERVGMSGIKIVLYLHGVNCLNFKKKYVVF